MLRDEKWIKYALGILKSVHKGSSSISEISEKVGGSESYIAKIVATLRKADLITRDYSLPKKPDQILVKDLLVIANTYKPSNDPVGKIIKSMLESLTMPITEIW